MKIIKNNKGIETLIFAETFEQEAYDQIKNLVNFEAYENQNVFPEVGSRSMTRVITEPQGWINVQDGLYRYCVSWSSKKVKN